MPLSEFEHQLYSLLIEMKQSAATTSADMRALKESFSEIRTEIEDIEEMCVRNSHDIIKLKASLKAWITAAAAVGGLVSWILAVLKEVLTTP